MVTSGTEVILQAPGRAVPDPTLNQWFEPAHRVMAELLPNAVDASTRQALAERILAPPTQHIQAQNRALERLLGAHRTLRWSARRVLLSAIPRLSQTLTGSTGTSPRMQHRTLALLAHSPLRATHDNADAGQYPPKHHSRSASAIASPMPYTPSSRSSSRTSSSALRCGRLRD